MGSRRETRGRTAPAPAPTRPVRHRGHSINATDIERYFDLSQAHQLAAVSDLVLTKPASSQPASVANAEALMEKAARGEIARRGPITVRQRSDGRYDVVDGNATTAVLMRWKWDLAPVQATTDREEQL